MDLWLPLTQDTRQQGLSNASVTAVGSGASINANGKLGKCYYLDGTSNGYITTDFPTNFGTNDFTISLWVKIPTISSGSYYAIVSSKQSAAISAGVGIYWNYTQKKFLWSTADGTNATEIWMADAVDTIVYDKWIHLVMVRDNNDSKKGCFYINGTRYELASVPVIRNITTATNLWVGRLSPGNYPCKLYISDIRVWNGKALSPKEIEVLSRGLVCHYPLNNNGGGQPDLYDFESVASKWAEDGLTRRDYSDDVYGNVLKVSSGSTQSSNFRIYREVSNVWNSGQTYTVSFLAKASKSATVRVSRSVADYAPNFTVGTTWKRYSGQINCTTTATGGTLSIQLATLSTDLYITQVKLELGDKATVYCPGVGDSHYIPLGYDSTTIYDCSGYQNNATPWAYDTTGSIEYDSTTPRYSVSTFINSANVTNDATGIRYIYGNCELTTPQYLTVAFWCNPIAGYGGITNNGIFALTNNDIGVGAATDYNTAPMHNRDADIDMCTSTNVHKTMAFTTTANEWHHYAVVYDGRYGKVYKDGVHTATLDMGSNLSLASFKAIVIGYSHAGGVYRKVRAYYSDFRIYATALSDAQIAELYNTAVSVSNNGALLGYELVES